MKLSEAIIEAMNDIDEALLEGSEVIDKKESIFSKKGWLILTSVVVALVVMLPMISNMFRMGSSQNNYHEAKSEEVYESESAADMVEEAVTSEEESMLEILYAEDLLEAATNSSEEMMLVEISATFDNGMNVPLRGLELLAADLEEKGYEVQEINADYILVKVKKEEILKMNINVNEEYNIYIKSHK